MEARDSREVAALSAAGWLVRRELLGVGLLGGLAGLLVWHAVAGAAGVPAAVLWFFAGVTAAGVAEAVMAGWSALVALRRARRCRRCLAALVAMDEGADRHDAASASAARCARSRHREP